MTTLVASTVALRRWSQRIKKAHRDLALLLGSIGAEHWTWSPDDGFPSAAHCAVEALRAAEFAAAQLAGEAPRRGTARNLTAAEVSSRLEHAIRTLLNRLECAVPGDLDGDVPSAEASARDSVEDAIFAAIAACIRAAGEIRFLLRLIDPALVS